MEDQDQKLYLGGRALPPEPRGLKTVPKCSVLRGMAPLSKRRPWSPEAALHQESLESDPFATALDGDEKSSDLPSTRNNV